MDDLAEELATYNKNLPILLKDEGRYAVVFGSEIVGICSAYDDALQKGYERAALEPFLVKKISRTEEVAYFTRDIGEICHTSNP